MKNYLSLIPISARVRRRQNRMTLLCIVFAVFLVTAIFSMANMFERLEASRVTKNGGNWHIRVQNITEEEAEEIKSRPDVSAASWYDVVNFDMDQDYFIDGISTTLCGIEPAFQTDIMTYLPEDSSVQSADEVILTPNAKKLLGVDVGDRVTVTTPAGSYQFRITGFRSGDSAYANSNGGETTALLVKEDNQIGAFMNIAAFRRIVSENKDESAPSYFIQFNSDANKLKVRAEIKKAMAEIKEQYGLTEEDIERHTILMGLLGLGENTVIQTVYPAAFLLFLLILIAGVLMISGSLNSNIAQRSQFFGMMRCIGMSKKQVIRFVRLEALNWCKTAIPAGAILGTMVSWILCAVLRYLVGGEFSETPVFGVSAIGIICGALVGVLTVIIAAQSPAKRAAKVSPMAAVSGSLDTANKNYHGAKTRFLKIETTLGVSHAVSAKKNLGLMACSFAFSIILFLCFSVLVQMLGCLLPTRADSPDIDIASNDGSNSIDHEIVEEIRGMQGVEHAFGRMYEGDIPATFSKKTDQTTVDMLSYDDIQLGYLVENHDLRKGSDLTNVYGDNGYVLAIWDESNPLEVGDKVQLCGSEVEIAGMQKFNPFSNSGRTDGRIILICSEATFTRLTGEDAFGVLDIQLTKDATDEDVSAIHDLVMGEYAFRDRRDESDSSTFWAFALFIYGFLVIIALIAVLNIVNSISMSVSARIKQYGAMRAVGMDGWQLTKMIAAEAATYAFSGVVIGCAIGLPLSKVLYDKLITEHFPYYTWSVPVPSLLIILLFVLAATVAAVYTPSKRIRNIEIIDTINEL